MTYRCLLLITAFLPAVSAANETEVDVVGAIAAVIDDFHDAAEQGDKQRYLGHLTEDAVFQGTDEWERWPKNPEFSDYVDSRFENGRGWSYRSVERSIRLAESAGVAWFDEVLFSERNGRFRGTGVLVRQAGKWKLAHYAMSFLVFNENWDDVIELSKKTRKLKEQPPTPQ